MSLSTIYANLLINHRNNWLSAKPENKEETIKLTLTSELKLTLTSELKHMELISIL